jgi:hypothetical protein
VGSQTGWFSQDYPAFVAQIKKTEQVGDIRQIADEATHR